MPDDRFIQHLQRLAGHGETADLPNRGALAALRKGLGKPPGTVAETHRYVAPFLPKDAPRWEQDCYYIVASLFALHPMHGEKDNGRGPNLGETLRAVAKQGDAEASVERRFVALLNAHRDELAEHLRHMLSLIRAHKQPVNYRRLLSDIKDWSKASRYVQRKWAEAFWREGDKPAEETEVAATTAEEN